MRAIGKDVQAASLPAAQPAVVGLAADAGGNIDHLGRSEPVPQHLGDGVEALLCHCELQSTLPTYLASPLVGEAQETRGGHVNHHPRRLHRLCAPASSGQSESNPTP